MIKSLFTVPLRKEYSNPKLCMWKVHTVPWSTTTYKHKFAALRMTEQFHGTLKHYPHSDCKHSLVLKAPYKLLWELMHIACIGIGGEMLLRLFALTLYQPMTHIRVMSSHKPIRIYMGGLILGVNTLYRLFCFFKLFPMVGKGLTVHKIILIFGGYLGPDI